MGRFISYLKARKIISKGYLYHLRVKNSSSQTPFLESIFSSQSVSRSEDLSEVPIEKEIDFEIDLLPDT